MDNSIARGVENYLIALLAVIVSAVASALLWPLSEAAPLALFYGAVAASARRGGAGPQAAATLGSALVGSYFFLPPFGSFQLELKSAGAVLIFLAVSTLVGWLVSARREPSRRPWFENFIEHIGEGAAVVDARGRIVHLNPIAERMTGWSLEEARGKPSTEVFRIVDEATARPRDPAAVVLADGGERPAPPTDSILITRNGVEVPIADAAAPIWEGAEKLAGVVMVVRDIPQRLRVRETLRQVEELNRRIIDNCDVCIKLLDLDGRILMINERGALLLEIDDPDDWIGRDLAEEWPEESRETLRDASRRAAAGERVQFEFLAPTVKGTPKWWDVSVAPLSDADGKPEKLLCIGRDVTDQKRTEDALRAGEERYRALFNSVDQGFCVGEMIFDDQGRPVDLRYLETNPAFESLSGLKDATGRTFREMEPDYEGPRLDIFGEVAATGEPKRYANIEPSLNGCWFDVHVFRFNAESNHVAMLFTNITEAVLTERERARLIKGLKNQRAELARLIENAPSFAAVLRGPNHVYERANAEYQKAVGGRELIGRPVAEAVPELREQGLIERMDQVYRTGEPFVAREVETYFDGEKAGAPTRRVANIVYQALRDLDGAITGIFIQGVDLTEQKRIEDALRAGEERYRALFNAIDEGFCVIEMIRDDQGRSIDFRYLETNPAFEAHTGLRDVVGRTLEELVEEDASGWRETLDRVARTGEPARLASLNPVINGRWFDLYAFRVDGGEDRKVAVIFRNITETVLADRERARLVRELEGQRADLKRLIEVAPAFICVLRGPDHVYELTNTKYEDLAGHRQFIGRPAAEAMPELKDQGYVDILDQVYRAGEPFVGREMEVYLNLGGSGEPTRQVANFVCQPLRDPDGAINGVFVHGVDVTEMVEANEAVKESATRYRQLAEAMPLPVWTTDANGTTGLCNQQFLEYFGLQKEDDVNNRWRDAVHPDDLESLNEVWAQSLRDGVPYEQELRVKRASDGEYRWQHVHAVPVRNEHGEIVRWIGANSDIDDHKRLSEALKQADQRKDEFLATLAHELRNPLSPIRTGLQILEMKPKEEVVASTVEMMSRQLGHMIALIDDLMDLARVGSGKINIRKERAPLRPIIETALERIRPAIEERKHKLVEKLTDEPIQLEADPTRIGQVVSNLLTNAAKYTEPGGRIEISTAREGREAIIRVKDSGVGLESNMLEKVFEMFSQVGASIKDSQGGLGIGLTVVKRLVELHGGRIEAKSDGPGLGSEFVVHLPIAANGPDQEGEPEPAPGAEAAAGLRVLVVDDNRDSAESLAKIVAMSGHQVSMAYNGEDALAAAELEPPDLVLLDLGLPGLNGYEVAERIRQTPSLRAAKIVAVTGWGHAEDRKRSREAGFDLHLVKPVDLGVLQALLDSGVDALKRQLANSETAPPSTNGPRADAPAPQPPAS